MIEIAAAACMIGAAHNCRDVVIRFEDENFRQSNCMTVGQAELAKWTLSHPNWRITRFSCRPAGSVARL